MASRFGMLQDLVVAIWRTEDIRAYARRHDLQGSLPEGVPLASLASEFVDLLQRRGMVDSELFDALAKTAPRRATEIAQVAEAWEVAWKAPAVKAAPMPPTAPEPPIQPVSNQGAPDVFIALGGSQRAAAVEVAELLRRRGWRVRLDADLTDQDWTTGLTDWIKTARAIVVLLPADWSTAKWLRHELPLIDERKQAEVSVQAFAEVVPSKPSESPPYTQAWNWRRWDPAKAQETADAVHAVLVGRLGAPEPTSEDPRPKLPNTVEAHRVALSLQLRQAHDALREVARRRGDEAPLRQEILRLKRVLNEGPALEPGMVLEHYELHEEIGRGGFGAVWRAWDLDRDRAVALKVMHPSHAQDHSRRERFFRGARQMAALVHPYVVRVLQERGEDRGFHYYVMELLPRGDLHVAVTKGGLGTHDALERVLEAGEALAVAHSRGVVHRDVKPHNILIGEDGRARLTDFDLVKAADTTGATKTGTLGTWLYVAPEATDGASVDVDARADVYGLAMTAAFCVLRADPGTSAMFKREAWLRGLPGGEAVRGAVGRGLELDPVDRPGMREFVEVLREAVRRDGAAGEPKAVTEVARASEARRAVHVAPQAVTPPPVEREGVVRGLPPKPAPEAEDSAPVPPTLEDPLEDVLAWVSLPFQVPSTTPVRNDAPDGGQRRSGRVWAPLFGVAGLGVLARMVWGGGGPEVGPTPRPVLEKADEAPDVSTTPAVSTSEVGRRLGEANISLPGGVTLKLAELSGGTFQMGSPEGVGDNDEHPQHPVTVSGFSIGLTEVTQSQWRSVVEAGKAAGIAEAAGLDPDPSYFEGLTNPVEQVSWCDTVRWLNVLSELRGREGESVAPVYEVSSTCESGEPVLVRTGVHGYRLPTEAEWEYAARAGCSADHCGPEGNPIPLSEAGWFDDNADFTKPVGGMAANPWGLYDTAGNVWEWTGDWKGDYASSPANNPTGPAHGDGRVIRGGSFVYSAFRCRPADRGFGPVDRFRSLGFRVALSAVPTGGGQ